MNLPEGTVAGRCRACDASMIWAVTALGRRIPLDPRPVGPENVAGQRGNVRVLAGRAVVVGRAARVRLDAAQERSGLPAIEWFISHFATCPDRRGVCSAPRARDAAIDTAGST